MSPLLLRSPSSGTPTSQDPDSQYSLSLSPLELDIAKGNSTSPDGALHGSQPVPISAVQQIPSSASTLTSLHDGNLTDQQAPNANLINHHASKTGRKRGDISSEVVATVASQPEQETGSPADSAEPRRASTDSAIGAPETKYDRPEAVRMRTTDSAKVRHNIVERRYRENINAQVDVLRDSIVATMQVKDEQNGTSSSRLGADELKRLTKAAVIAAATQQIKRARGENERLLDENRVLQSQIKELEKMVKCGECPLMQLSVDMGLESPT